MTDKNRKTELFETAPIPRAVFTMAVPTVLSSLVMVIYNLADTFFVGMLNDAVQTSAVTLAAPVLLAFNAVNNLFGVGTSSMMSRALGRKDFETMEKCCAVGFYLAAASGILFSVLCFTLRTPLLSMLGTTSQTVSATAGYLKWTVFLGAAPAILNVVMAYLVRSEGAALHASIGTMSGCTLNMILDPFFILPGGFGMGAAGAGCATFISNCTACGYFFMLLFLKRGRTHVCINPKKFCPEKDIVGGICAVGIPASIQNLLNVTSMAILNNFAALSGAEAVAAIGISQKLYMLPNQSAMGISQGIMPLLGYNYSSGNGKRMKQVLGFAVGAALSVITVITVFFHTFSRELIGLFIADAAVISHGEKLLKGMCLTAPFFTVDFMAVAVFQSCGMGNRSLLFAVLRKIVLEIPILFLYHHLFGLYGLAYAQCSTELVMSVIAVTVLTRLFRRMDAGTLTGHRKRFGI